MNLFSILDCSKSDLAKTLSIALCMSVIAGCEKPQEKPIEKPVPAKQIVEDQSKPQFTSNLELVAVNLPTCTEKYCLQIQIQRLHSNHHEVDQFIDQYILNYVSKMIQSFDIQEPISDSEQEDKPKSTPMTGIVEKRHQEEIQEKSIKDSAQQISANAKLAQQLQADIDKFVQLSNEVKALGGSSQQTLYIKPQVLNTAGEIITIVINSSNYVGGAHGSTAQYYLNFALTKQHILNLDQIIKQGQRKNFNDLVYKKYQEWVKETQTDMNVKAYEELWPFQISENFYLSSKGLILQYSEYEIGPYAVGLPRLEISYTELENILDPKYLPIKIKETKVTVPTDKSITQPKP